MYERLQVYQPFHIDGHGDVVEQVHLFILTIVHHVMLDKLHMLHVDLQKMKKILLGKILNLNIEIDFVLMKMKKKV